MKIKTLALSIGFGFLLLLPSCNNYTTKDVAIKPKVTIEENFADSILNTADSAKVDLKRIKSIKIYNYWCNSGWANMPAKLSLYTLDNVKLTPKEGDLVFSDIPFEDLIIDEWGCPIEWKAEDTGNYSGAPKLFKLGKTLDLTKYKRCIVPYILEVDKEKEIPYGGIQIAFVDKMGKETTNIYLDIFTLRK